MDWNFDQNRPIYLQIADRITRRIVSGTYVPGMRLPAVRELALDAGVNPNTMQRALSELERSGMVYSQSTSGRYVTEDQSIIDQARNDLAQRQISQFFSDMEELGYPRTTVLTLLTKGGEQE